MKNFFLIASAFVLFLNISGQTYSLQWQKPVYSPRELLVDSGGNSYVISDTTTLIKYNTAGNQVWQNPYIPGVAVKIKFDNSGNIIAVGTKTSTSGSLNNFYVCKFDTAGSMLWSKILDSLNLDNDLKSFTIDKSDNIILSGSSTISSSDKDLLTFKLNPAGTVLWCESFSSVAGGGWDVPGYVNCDSLQSIFVSFDTYSSGYPDSMCLLKYAPSGLIAGMKYFTGSPNPFMGPAGIIHTVLLKKDIRIYFKLKPNSFGTAAIYALTDTSLSAPIYSAIPLGTGFPSGPGSFYQGSALPTDVKAYDKQNFILTAGSQTVITNSGGSYYTSYYPYIQSKAHGSFFSTPGGSRANLLPNGNYLHSFVDMSKTGYFFLITDPLYNITTTVTAKAYAYPSATVALCGQETDSLNSVYILYQSSSGSYLEKYAMTTGINEIQNLQGRLFLYPNPANDKAYISTKEPVSEVTLHDLSGRLIKNYGVAKEIDLNGIATGIYLVKIKTAWGEIHRKLIKE